MEEKYGYINAAYTGDLIKQLNQKEGITIVAIYKYSGGIEAIYKKTKNKRLKSRRNS